MKGAQLKQTVVNLFGIIKERSTNDELVFVCPEPGCGDRSGNRSVSLKNGRTNCWRCNKGGDFVKWVKHLGYKVDGNSVQDTGLESLERTLEQTATPTLSAPVYALIRLPDGFTRCEDDPDSVYTRHIASMAQRKNLSVEDFIEAGVGFTRRGAWEPFAIFPVIERGRTVYYQGRTYIDEPGEKTKKFPSRRECPISSKYWVYNIDAVPQPDVRIVVAVESILNCLSLKRKFDELGIVDTVPVCVFKHALSREQARKLHKYTNIQELVLLFDHDAIRESWEDASDQTLFKMVSVAEMPYVPGQKKLDPNDDVDLALDALASRKPFRVSSNLDRLCKNILGET